VHSADSRKKQIISSEIQKLLPGTTSPSLPTAPATPTNTDGYFAPFDDSAAPAEASSASLVVPLDSAAATELLTGQSLDALRDDFEGTPVLNGYKDELELFQFVSPVVAAAATPNQPPSTISNPHAFAESMMDLSAMSDPKGFFSFQDDDADIDTAFDAFGTDVGDLGATRGRKRKLADRDPFDSTSAPSSQSNHHQQTQAQQSSQQDLMFAGPPSKRTRYSLDARSGLDHLFFRSLPFLTTEELRSLCQTAPIPIYVKDEANLYKWCNRAFCSFILDVTEDPRTDRIKDEPDESAIKPFNDYMMRSHTVQYKLTKHFARLRDGAKVYVGAITC
jgi:hypothetical protein